MAGLRNVTGSWQSGRYAQKGGTMTVVTIAEAWPDAGRPFTVTELDRMPDDGRRYELLDGVLIVSPRPTTIHQFVAMRLLRVLADACPEDLCVVPEPAVELGSQTEFDPDLVVVRMDQIGGAKFTEPPLLVVEIRSPSTALVDLNRKKAAYERFGVPTYWIVNPDPPEPELSIFELRDSRYVPAAKASKPFAVDRPFRVSIHPGDLTRGLRRLPEIRGMPGAGARGRYRAGIVLYAGQQQLSFGDRLTALPMAA